MFFIFVHQIQPMAKDTQILLKTDDRIMAEDISSLLEESEIFTLLRSDNPASSVMGMYVGVNPPEGITMIVNVEEYPKAKEIIQNSHFAEVVQLF